ncbi:uncharacterized protein [Brachyistius frenatus]|uniref:uncharacterized protein n=1 Tax=Brachyistius frenatus TaxID=100188 RepID=UPI0037E8FA3A
MDQDGPDFVPSVFTCSKQSRRRCPENKVNRLYSLRKRAHRTANAETEDGSSLTEVDSPDAPQSSGLETASELPEETLTPARPSVPKEGKAFTGEAETDTETKEIQTTFSLSKTLLSFKATAGTPRRDKMSPIVLLKPVVSPAGCFQCEQCNQTFTNASQLVKHKPQHEERRPTICDICGKFFTDQADFNKHYVAHPVEPLFPCNMCDRYFTSTHNLKRHKLLHVKDGRKCPKCGTLFCRRHNHLLFRPQTEFKEEPKEEPQEESSTVETQDLDSDWLPESGMLNKVKLSQMTKKVDNVQSSQTIIPLLTLSAPTVAPTPFKIFRCFPITCETLPPTSNTITLPEIPQPVFLKPSPVQPCPPSPTPSASRSPDASFQMNAPSDNPATLPPPHIPQHEEFPPSLRMFSPRYLTSALLEVKRDYEYILRKSKGVVVEKIAKAEPDEPLMISPCERSIKQEENERTAYDLEVVL